MTDIMNVLLLSIWDVRIGVTVAVFNGFRPMWALGIGTSSSIAIVIPAFSLLRRFLRWSRRYAPSIRAWLLNVTHRHHRSIDRYGYVGLFLLVAFPLPGTGPWTGAICASLLNMDPVRASMSLTMGIIMAGLFALGITEGILSLFPFIS